MGCGRVGRGGGGGGGGELGGSRSTGKSTLLLLLKATLFIPVTQKVVGGKAFGKAV